MTASLPVHTPESTSKFRTAVQKGFLPVNDADNWLHLGLAVAMIALGATLGRKSDDTARPVGTDSTTSAGFVR